MRGQYVLLRAFGNKPIVRRIWDVTEDTVYIVSAENFERLTADLSGLWPVAFPRSDVFHYDESLASLCNDGRPLTDEAWAQMQLWSPSETVEDKEVSTLYLVH